MIERPVQDQALPDDKLDERGLLARIQSIEDEISRCGDPAGELDAHLICLGYLLAAKCDTDFQVLQKERERLYHLLKAEHQYVSA